MRVIISASKLEKERDVLAARSLARRISGLLGFDDLTQTEIATALSAVAGASFAAAPGVRVEFAIEGAEIQILCLRVDLHGACDAALEAGRRLMDGCEVETGPRPVVRMEMLLPPRPAPMTAKSLARIADALALEQSDFVLAEIARQDKDFLRVREHAEAQQKELAQVNQELEDTNRGVMALYTELDERTRQLRSVSELKSRFLSNFSHEVRTPLNSVIALSGILLNRLDGELTAEQEKQVTYIRDSAEQLLRQVNDEVDLAKVEAGKISLRLKEFQVEDIFAALRGMFKPLLNNPAVSLVFDEPQGIPAVYTDEGKVAQILRNLISNALKFTPSGEVRVSARFDESRREVVFTVADTGVGIASKNLELLFQEFFRAESELGPDIEGAGIGLFLSRRLAEFLGGTLTVASQVQAGSVFTATIPLLARHSGRIARASKLAASGPDVPILIIDDDELSRYLIRQNIGDMDCRILEAASGMEGLSLARSEKPVLIFLDLIMPDLSGVTVLRELKAEPSTRDIPVVIFTSKSLDETEHRQLAPQVMAVISKSNVSREGLRTMIQNYTGIIERRPAC